MNIVLNFIRPEYETPISISGNSLLELSDRIDKTIEKKAHDVYISVDDNKATLEEIEKIEEIASMLLMKGHFLAQSKYCPNVDIVANDEDHYILDSQHFYMSSLNPNMLDMLFNAFYGGHKMNAMLKLTDGFQYTYFDSKNKQEWVRKVGYKVEDHFNKRLKELKNSKKD
jgi:hypothetical protein